MGCGIAENLTIWGMALYKGAAAGMVELVIFLVDRGANAHFGDQLGRSPMAVAKENEHDAVVRAVLALGN